MSEQEIFLAAVEMAEPRARQAFLDKACSGNEPLRRQVEALLKAHADAANFLETPALAAAGLDSASATSLDEKTRGYGDGGDEISLDFLSPSQAPGSLGRLGHYEVHEVLGQGAFGIVLKAFDEKLHRIVAVKVMSPELAATSPPRKRFLREARAAAAIRHENVVAVYAVEEQPLPYLVMEFIPGKTLDDALKEHGPLDVADILRIGQQIACGLAAAHAQGLIHRDIKPSNILLESGLAGRLKISDFGLARAADDASQTQSGTIAGTPMFMSPEQATTGQLDQRSDLFSLGSVLYVMTSGRPPFRAANTLAVLKRVVEDTPRPIREIIAGTPDWLCAIIAKLQAKKPDDRFATAQEVADLLGKCLADLQGNRPVVLPDEIRVEEKVVTTAAPVNRLSASDVPSRHESTRRAWPTIAAVALILLAGLGITEATGVTELTSTVIRVASGSGTLVIESNDPNIDVTIDGQDLRIQGAGVKSLTLTPGEHKVRINKDGVQVSHELVTITRGGKQVVKVTMEGIASSTPVSDDPNGSAAAATARQHKLAFEQPGFDKWVNEVQKLPAEDQIQAVSQKLMELNPGFDGRVSGLEGRGDPKIVDGQVVDLQVYSDKVLDLSPIRAIQKLENFACGGTAESSSRLSDLSPLAGTSVKVLAICHASIDDLTPLAELPLTALSLRRIPATDLAPLKGLQLIHLNCRDMPVKDLSALKGMPLRDLLFEKVPVEDISPLNNMNISWLKLEVSEVTDLSPLRTMLQLRNLSLFAIKQITDSSLSHLAHVKTLRGLILEGTNVTSDGVNNLALALPGCQISWDGGVIEPTLSDDPDRRAAEWVLSIGGSVFVREVDKPSSDFIPVSGKLPEWKFKLTGALLQNTPIDDAALANLKTARGLERLQLTHCDVSKNGLVALAGLPIQTLELAGGRFQYRDLPAIVTAFPRLSTLDLRDLAGDRGQGLAPLASLPTLSSLQLDAKHMVAEVAELREIVSLREIGISGTKVTEASVQQLAAALPRCRIEWDGGVIEPREIAPESPSESLPPLSEYALVQRPAVIKGLQSWTLETVGHRGMIEHMSASPDGRHFATGGEDGTIRVWDALAGKLVRVLVGHAGTISDLQWSPDGKWIASTTGWAIDGVRIWEADTGNLAQQWNIQASALAWLQRAGKLYLTTGSGDRAQLWLLGAQVPEREIALPVGPRGMAWSPDGKFLAVCDNRIFVWDDQQSQAKLHVEEELGALSLAWSTDGKTLATGHIDGFRLWDLETSQSKVVSSPGLAAHHVAWLPGQPILLVGRHGGAFPTDVPEGESSKRYGFTTQGLACSPRGDWVAVSNQGPILILDAKTGRTQHQLPGYSITLGSLTFAPRRGWLAYSITDQAAQVSQVHAWNQPQHQFVGPLAQREQSTYGGTQFSPDEEFLAVVDPNEGVAELWQIGETEVRDRFPFGQHLSNPVWSPDNQLLASYAGDGLLRIWDNQSRQMVWTSEGLEPNPQPLSQLDRSLAWSPDSRSLAVNGLGDREISFWDRDSHQLRADLNLGDLKRANRLDWSPDHPWLAVADDSRKQLRFWDVATGRERLVDPIPFEGGLQFAGWVPGTAQVALWSSDQTVRVVQTETGKVQKQYVRPGAFDKRLRGSAVGLTTGRDHQIWNLASGTSLGSVIATTPQKLIVIDPTGRYAERIAGRSELIYVAKDGQGQRWYTPEDFSAAFGWHNQSREVTIDIPAGDQ